jgi:hypothetical protein
MTSNLYLDVKFEKDVNFIYNYLSILESTYNIRFKRIKPAIKILEIYTEIDYKSLPSFNNEIGTFSKSSFKSFLLSLNSKKIDYFCPDTIYFFDEKSCSNIENMGEFMYKWLEFTKMIKSSSYKVLNIYEWKDSIVFPFSENNLDELNSDTKVVFKKIVNSDIDIYGRYLPLKAVSIISYPEINGEFQKIYSKLSVSGIENYYSLFPVDAYHIVISNIVKSYDSFVDSNNVNYDEIINSKYFRILNMNNVLSSYPKISYKITGYNIGEKLSLTIEIIGDKQRNNLFRTKRKIESVLNTNDTNLGFEIVLGYKYRKYSKGMKNAWNKIIEELLKPIIENKTVLYADGLKVYHLKTLKNFELI